MNEEDATMRKVLFGAVSAAALLAGTAFAQTQGTDQPMQPTEPPAASGDMAAPGGAAPGGMTDDDMAADEMAAPDAAEPADDSAAMDEPAVTTEPADTATAPAASTPPSGTEVSADDMIGRTVYGEEDQEIGEVTDVIVDPDTKQVSRLVVGTGGFLGIGEKTVALDMNQVEIRPEQGIYVSGLRQEDIEGMEEYNPDDATASLDEPAPATTGAPAGGMGSPTAPPPATAPASE
jgi:sporulation protein YlmC with PRC-barrel domain